MKVSIFSRFNEHQKWGGDLEAMYSIAQGMSSLGVDATVISDFSEFTPCDMMFLTSTCLDLREHIRFLNLIDQPYSLIGFHEDQIKYGGVSLGFYEYIKGCLAGACDPDLPEIPFSLEALLENPHLIHYYTVLPRKHSLRNYEVMKQARVCFANSHAEARTMKRDCPSCNAQVVHLTSGAAVDFKKESSREFLDFTGLSTNGYILQVGRCEPRKNQLATILSTRDLDIPLVFIATQGGHTDYEFSCLEAILKWRKAPTIVISQYLAETQMGPLRVIAMPNREKLSLSMLQSAFAHAALHLHPAFMELPGYTYFESVALGTPTIASSWATIDEYFASPPLDDRMEYCEPYDLPAMTRLIEKKLGKRYPTEPVHPVFKRTRVDVAREILGHLGG